jgi:hypothetical protein
LLAALLAAGAAVAMTGATTDGSRTSLGLEVRWPAVAAVPPDGLAFTVPLTLINHGTRPLRLLLSGTIAPELVNARGEAVAFSSGSNRYAPPHAADVVDLMAGQSLTRSVTGVLHHDQTGWSWRGGDGLLGLWPQEPGPLRLRLRYRQANPTTDLVDRDTPATGLWTGTASSNATPLLRE